MNYISTRGEAPVLEFGDVLLTGLARDGGLYVPESWPRFTADEIAGFAGLSYAEMTLRVIAPFVGDAIPPAALARLVEDAYADFTHAAVAPLRQIGRNDWLLELFHGPTLAFKDYAMQLLGRLFDHVLSTRGEHVTIVGATSGDTGSAAIEACRDRANIEIFILHPKDRVSDVQRRQMTTVTSPNVYNIAIEGTFDDCQALLKAMFNDTAFRDELRLSAANSINWARVMAQSVYYFYAAVALGAPRRDIVFSVPTGNFGCIFAGYVARKMGLPVSRLIIATNANDILARFIDSGEYRIAEVTPTLSPSMDIQVSSNFERLLFDMHDRDAASVTALMAELSAKGRFAVDPTRLKMTRDLFAAHRADDRDTESTIAAVHRETGATIDPHTAVGVAAAAACRGDRRVPMITLAPAHPAKFPEAVERATGAHPALPPPLADLFDRSEYCDTLPNDLATVQAFVRESVGERRVGKGAA